MTIDEFIQRWRRNWEETGTWKSKFALPGWEAEMKADLEEMMKASSDREEILQRMGSHKFNCSKPFHSDCIEWLSLKQSLESIGAREG